MKKIGIVGGLGPESTVAYYKEIIAAFNTDLAALAYPEIIICSANLKECMEYVAARDWAGFSEWLLGKIFSLHRAGAEFAAIASNTPHVVFDELRSRSPIPLVSIVEKTCERALGMGLKKIGLMGTKLTMEADFYKKPFLSRGISIVVPMEAERSLIDHRLFSEIELGVLKDSTREELFAIAKRMVNEEGIDSLILGCTELPLIMTERRFGIPFLNTTEIHCRSIIRYCIGGEQP
jgi:aspartate racemase